jgi:two-component system, NtrC family, nitrogen regulation sensor histidine kinase NtrY
MITPGKVRNHLFIALFCSAVLFFSALIISTAFKNYYTPQNIAERLNREIAASCRELDADIEKLAAINLEDNSSWYHVFNTNYRDAFSDRGVEILVYRNDSLKFWTSNVFAAPLMRDSQNFSTEVIRTGSGYYLARQKQVRNFYVVALQLIRYDYRYVNDYLPSGFFKKFSAPANAALNLSRGKYEIKNPEGKFLFSLTYEQPFELPIWLQYLVFALYISSFLFLVSALFILYAIISKEIHHKWLLFLAFVLDVVILRALQFYFRFPADLYQVLLFDPAYFASSDMLPSLGDFLINALLGVQLTFLAYKYQHALGLMHGISAFKKQIAVSVSILLIVVLYFLLNETIAGLVINSSISFRFENILSLPHISHTGMLIIACLLFGFMLVFELVGKLFLRWSINRSTYITAAISGVLLYGAITFISGDFDPLGSLFLFILFAILFFKINENTSSTYQVSRIILLVIVLSVFATNLLNHSETLRENIKNVRYLHLIFRMHAITWLNIFTMKLRKISGMIKP